MESREDQLPPKQRLPRTFRTCVGNDSKARSHCPINGTRPFNLVKFACHRQQDHERKRKAQAEVRRVAVGIERQAAGSGAQETRGMEKPLSRGTQPAITHPPTIVPKAEYFHSWSIHDQAAAAAAEPVHHHFATTPARTVPRQPSHPPPAAMNAQERHVAPGHTFIQFQPPDARATTISSSPCSETTYTGGNAFATHFATIGPALETDYSSSAGLPTSPPTTKLEDPQVSIAAPSAHVAPKHNPESSAAQGSVWSEDDFIAAYQHYFLPCPIDGSSSPAQTLGMIKHDPDNETTQQANDAPAPKAYATKPTFTDTATATVGHGTGELCPHDARQASNRACATKLKGGDLVDWSIWRMPLAPAIDPQQSEALEKAATAGYPYTLQLQRSLVSSAVPEEAYVDLHPTPSPVPSSDSELAHALECHPNISVSSSAHAWATTLRPAVSVAEHGTSLYTRLRPGRGLRHTTGTRHRPAVHDHFNMA